MVFQNAHRPDLILQARRPLLAEVLPADPIVCLAVHIKYFAVGLMRSL